MPVNGFVVVAEPSLRESVPTDGGGSPTYSATPFLSSSIPTPIDSRNLAKTVYWVNTEDR